MTNNPSKQCVVDIAWRIVNSAMDTAASANGVIVHRQLIGELREALRTDFIRAAESPAETAAEPCSACVEAHGVIPSEIPDGDIADRVGDLVGRFEALWKERDELKETLAHLARGGVTSETPVAQASKEQQFREALARIAAGFYTEQGAERHAKDIIRIIDAEEKTIPRFRGKPCTCDNCLGSSVPCRVDAGERLGELWYCRKAAESSLKSTAPLPDRIMKEPQ